MNHRKVYDLLGIGIGPFNLGLAALCHGLPNLSCLFLDSADSFNWHPGLLLTSARLQVPFYADLVTMADPCSPFSYLAFLKAKGRLFRFAIHEHYFPTRLEYNTYCKWVAAQLSSLRFSRRCQKITWSKTSKEYTVQIWNRESGRREQFYAKHLVIGTGTVPYLPACAHALQHPLVFHSGHYLDHKERLLQKSSITIIGSGQSAAEIFHDLLQHRRKDQTLNWFTRSERFHPMEYSKLTLEMTSPDYIDHFYSLSPGQKAKALQGQHTLYKGINFSLINEIYDTLYMQSLQEDNIVPRTSLYTHCELQSIQDEGSNLELQLHHSECDQNFFHLTEALILATGYRPFVPAFLISLKDQINLTPEGRYKVSRHYTIDRSEKSIFVQNADLHTHGFNSADLGLGPYRNAIILNSILGHEHFDLEKEIAFQNFGIPQVL